WPPALDPAPRCSPGSLATSRYQQYSSAARHSGTRNRFSYSALPPNANADEMPLKFAPPSPAKTAADSPTSAPTQLSPTAANAPAAPRPASVQDAPAPAQLSADAHLPVSVQAASDPLSAATPHAPSSAHRFAPSGSASPGRRFRRKLSPEDASPYRRLRASQTLARQSSVDTRAKPAPMCSEEHDPDSQSPW